MSTATKRKKVIASITLTCINGRLTWHFPPLKDDEEKIREELGDLIDDNPIEEDDSGSDSGGEKKGAKRKHDDDDDELDDRLSDDDFDLLEENLGIKVKVGFSYNLIWL